VHQLEIKVLDNVEARCNHEVYAELSYVEGIYLAQGRVERRSLAKIVQNHVGSTNLWKFLV